MRQHEWYRQVGHILAQRRRQLGLTQTEVAEELGLSYQMLQKYEKGHSRPPLHVVTALAALYRLPLTGLLPANS